MEASGAGGFEPWGEPKIRALAAACFHRVPRVNQSALNFSMLPRGGARNHGHGEGKERKGEGPGRRSNVSRTGSRGKAETQVDFQWTFSPQNDPKYPPNDPPNDVYKFWGSVGTLAPTMGALAPFWA